LKRTRMAIAELPIASTGEIRAPAVVTAAAPAVRLYFGALWLLSLGAFVFGVENRFISDGLIRVPPLVDWIPPLSAQEWFEAFAIHQRDPAFAACGGTESLALFKVLYWWEWLRRASLVALGAIAAIGFYCALLWQKFRFVLPRLGGLALLVFVYWITRNVVELSTREIEAISSFNVGQYRHAIDVTFTSAAAAAVLASAVVPPVPARAALLHRIDRIEWLWITVILVDICFGGLFTGRNAAAFWWTWPGYEGHVLPPLEELISYSPWWLNFTFNPYTIQLVHRSLSEALWIAALWQLVSSMLRAHHLKQAIVRFVLISVQMFTGVATLFLIAPAALSIVHQVGPIFMLAASLVFLKSSQGTVAAAPIRAQPAH
jgi:cytochrome c oxidase assembly protein subunit 15